MDNILQQKINKWADNWLSTNHKCWWDYHTLIGNYRIEIHHEDEIQYSEYHSSGGYCQLMLVHSLGHTWIIKRIDDFELCKDGKDTFNLTNLLMEIFSTEL